MIKAIIFDLGKVIVQFDFDRGFQRISQFCNYSIDEIRDKLMTSNEIRLYETGQISSSQFFGRIKQNLTLTTTYEQFFEAWNIIFLDKYILSEDFIAELSKKYRLIMLSDTSESHIKFLRKKLPHFKHFSDFVFSYEIGELKPSAKMFEAAIEKANCQPNECFFVDDKLVNVEGAIACGIEAVQFVSAEQFENDLKMRNLI